MCILIFQWLSETQVLFAGHNFPLCRINSIICPRSRSWGCYRHLTFSAVCGSPRCGLCTLDCKQGQTIPVSINTPKRDLTGPALPDIVSKPASLFQRVAANRKIKRHKSSTRLMTQGMVNQTHYKDIITPVY